MMTINIPEDTKRRWAAEQRLSFIDFRLYWEGRINRADLIEKFGISPQQASADLQEYLKLEPTNAEYDRSAKVYLATEGFEPLRISSSASVYLDELLALGTGTKDEKASFIGQVPSFGTTPVIGRQVEPSVLVAMLDAIRSRRAIEIEYQSFSTPEPEWRWISPHALGYASTRWHARAFCHRKETYGDFVLARIIRVGNTQPAPENLSQDSEWNRSVEVRFGPHPGLSEKMKRRIEWDFGMENGAGSVRVREALVFYTLRNLLLDKESEKLSPQRRQLELLNPEDLERFR